MAKQKPKIQDQGSAMERILGIRKAEDIVEAHTAEAEKPAAEAPVKEIIKKGRAAKKQPYIQTAFYITVKQHKALKMRAARGENQNEKDMSAIVRTALDAYLGL